MKKVMRLLVMTCVFATGTLFASMAQTQVIARQYICPLGGRFYVSFEGIFSGNPTVFLCIKKPGQVEEYRNLGNVSGFGIALVSAMDEAEYWFGCYVKKPGEQPYFEYRLCAVLTVRQPGPSGSVVDESSFKERRLKFFYSFVGVKEEALAMKPRVLTLT